MATRRQELMSSVSLNGHISALKRDSDGVNKPGEPLSAGELEEILGQIKAALDHNLPYLAVATALTLPDICSALESADGRATSQKYIAWFDRHLGPTYRFLTGQDCYKLRCGVSHQGRMGNRGMSYSRIIFSLPDGKGNSFHHNIVSDALNLDAAQFCADMANAVRLWYAGAKNEKAVINNIAHLVRYRPDGISPYMVGIPLIS